MKTQTTLQISGMSCNHCVHAVRSALTDLDGIEVHNVEIGSVTFSHDAGEAALSAATAAVEEEGYTVTSMEANK